MYSLCIQGQGKGLSARKSGAADLKVHCPKLKVDFRA